MSPIASTSPSPRPSTEISADPSTSPASRGEPASPNPFPAPPLAHPRRSPWAFPAPRPRAAEGSPEPASTSTEPAAPGSGRPAIDTLYDALAAARELTLTSVRLTHPLGRGEHLDLVSDLRRTTAGVALGLETRTARSLLGSLHALWRSSDLIDRAERRGLLTLEQALELLSLGSRVEIPLMAFLRRCGLEIALGPEERTR